MRYFGARGHEDGTSDEALLAGIASGDESSVLLFVRRYQHRLFGLAVRIVDDARIAEEVTQEAFIRIFRHAEVFDPRRSSVTTWCFTITRNLAIDAIRMRRDQATDPDDLTFASLVSADRLPDDLVAAGDTLGRVRRALTDLPIEQRRAVVLAAIYGRTGPEIAELEGVPLGTVKSRLRLGMAKLRDALEIEVA